MKVLVDGADITASCANQISPLSYAFANQVKSYSVIAGINPVSAVRSIYLGLSYEF